MVAAVMHQEQFWAHCVALGCFDMQPGRAEIQTSDRLDYSTS